MIHTRESVKTLLINDDRAVEKAIVAIYRRQTASEQASSETRDHNGVGFASCHARNGTYWAKWILAGRHLSGLHLIKARKVAQKYIRQLLEIAEGHAATPDQELRLMKRMGMIDVPPVEAKHVAPPRAGDWG